MTKRCAKCKLHLPANSFGRDRSRYDGLAVYCVTCQRIVATRYRKANREKVRAMNAAWKRQNRAKQKESR